MMQWNLHSNACDVLGLGPRTAGKLAAVGIRTVVDLLAAKPAVIANRLQEKQLAAEVLAAWQCEAQLVIQLPQLSSVATRTLAAVGYDDIHQLNNSTPTELLSLIESTRRNRPESWLAQEPLPSISAVSDWIYLASAEEISRAA